MDESDDASARASRPDALEKGVLASRRDASLAFRRLCRAPTPRPGGSHSEDRFQKTIAFSLPCGTFADPISYFRAENQCGQHKLVSELSAFKG